MRSAALLLVLLLPLAACGEADEEAHVLPAAPGPAEPGRDDADGAPWGDAVDGLQLGLDVPSRTYAVGEEMVFGVRARNVADAPLHLPRFEDQTWWYQVRFESLDGGPDFLGGSGLFIEFEASPDLTLGPGETWAREADLTSERRRFLRVVPDRRPGDDWDYRSSLPAGGWRAVLVYENGRAGDRGSWTGRAETNAVAIEVREAHAGAR